MSILAEKTGVRDYGTFNIAVEVKEKNRQGADSGYSEGSSTSSLGTGPETDLVSSAPELDIIPETSPKDVFFAVPSFSPNPFIDQAVGHVLRPSATPLRESGIDLEENEDSLLLLEPVAVQKDDRKRPLPPLHEFVPISEEEVLPVDLAILQPLGPVARVAHRATPRSLRESVSHSLHTTHEVLEVASKTKGIFNGVVLATKEASAAASTLKTMGRTLNSVQLGGGIGFDALEGITSLGTLVIEGAALTNALRQGRHEDAREHGAQVLSASISGSSAGLGMSQIFVEIAEKGFTHLAHALGEGTAHVAATEVAAHYLGIAGWVIYGGIQAAGVRRTYKALKTLESAMRSEEPLEVRQFEALDQFIAQYYVSKDEANEMKAKFPDTDEGRAKFIKKLSQTMLSRRNKLTNRVGKKVAEKIYSELVEIHTILDGHKRETERASEGSISAFSEDDLSGATERLTPLLEKYKQGLAKQFSIKIAKFIGATFGIIGAGVVLVNPIIGASIAGATAIYLIQLWAINKWGKEDRFADGSLFKTFFDIKVTAPEGVSPTEETNPVIEEVFEEEGIPAVAERLHEGPVAVDLTHSINADIREGIEAKEADFGDHLTRDSIMIRDYS